MGYRVVGDFAAVTVGDPDGNGVVRLLERGAVVATEGVHASVLQHLVDVGQIEEFEDESAFDLDTAKVDELKAYADEHGIDLGDATKKDDIKAVIAAASA